MHGVKLVFVGIGIISMIGVGIAMSIAIFSEPSNTTQNETLEFSAFSAPQNVFESLTQKTDVSPSILTGAHSADTTTELTVEQEEALDSILNAWEATVQTSNTQSVAVDTQKPITVTKEVVEQAEITDIFNTLLGAKITDAFKDGGQGVNNNEYASGDIWSGAYTNSAAQEEVVQSTNVTQESLRTYGNTLGNLLKQFNNAQGDQSARLDTFIKNQNNTGDLLRLADAYETLSETIRDVEEPTTVRSIHTGLVISYKAVGELLSELQLAQNDADLMERMLTYNVVAEDVTKHLVSLITLFKAYNVTFKSHEAGAVFMFSSVSKSSF